MKQIFVLGTGPLFGPDVTFFSGQAHRTWHFARVIAATGATVDLVVLQVEGDAHKDPTQPALVPAQRDDLPYHIVNAAHPEEIKQIVLQRVEKFAPDALVTVNVNASYLACQLPTWVPIWADLYGHLMGEAQAKCLRDKDDRLLQHFWQRQRIILRRADRFSTVSLRQKLATLGELGAVGRLNRFTASYRFIDVIPSAASEEYLSLPTGHYVHQFRGSLFPNDAFAVLWSGGFNTWTDPIGFAAALSLAMDQLPRLHLVITGGAIKGHDEKSFEEFREKMAQAGLLDRCHFLGWIEGERLLTLYRDVDLGLNFDALIYESVFGARTRLTNMMAAGLPVLTTLCTEISEIIEQHQLGFTVAPGDITGYAECLVRAAKNLAECRRRGKRAREYVKRYYSYETTAEPLLEWLQHPQLAPDNEEKKRLFPDHSSPRTVPLNPVEEEAMWLEMQNLQQLVTDAHRYRLLQRHPLYRFWKSLKQVFKSG